MSEKSAIIVLNNVQRARIILGGIPLVEIEDCNKVGDQEILDAISKLYKAELELQKLIKWKK